MKSIIKIYIGIVFTLFATSCHEEITVIFDNENSDLASHGEGYAPDYEVVFDDTKLQRMDIEFSSDEWSDMQDDLASNINGGQVPGGTFDSEDPSYFPANITYNGLTWNNVGVRYKGNSSIRANSGKLPLRFQFDEFEYEYEGILNQRFYGFKELSMRSNYNDPSLIREKTADGLFRDFGVPAVRTAFYEVYVDKGNGPEYFGVYTMCEIVFDTFLNDHFGSDTGNCYKPEDDGASFATNGFTLDGFELKTNTATGDKSDITELYNLLHADTRNSNPSQWRSDLESVFDVDGFLKYLAVNNTIQNWDTYGRMPHNYFLYHDPSDDLIKWIVWDYNEAFQTGKNGGAISFAMSEIGTNWPLINYIANDEVYYEEYKNYIKSFIETTFETNTMNGTYSEFQTLLEDAADAERSGYSYVNGQFSSAISAMKAHNVSRVSSASSFVN